MSTKIKILAVIITGLMGMLMYPTVFFGYKFPDLGFLAWVYLVPLFIVIHKTEGKKSFRVGFFSSFIFYLGSLYWLIPAMKNFGGLSFSESIGVLLLIIIILSCYFGFSLFLASKVREKSGLPSFIVFPIFLVSFDFLRTYFPASGFPWSMAAYSQGNYLSYFQWIELTGVYGLHYLIFMVNVLIAEIVRVKAGHSIKDHFINRVIILIIIIIVSFSASILRQKKLDSDTKTTHDFKVALIQGNISQGLKWNSQLAAEHLNQYILLTKMAVEYGVELSIWPETSYPYTLELLDIWDRLINKLSSLEHFVLMGAVSQLTFEGEPYPKLFNSAFMVDKRGRVGGLYHKKHLVPFGEYVPLKKYLTFASPLTEFVGDVSPGQKTSLLLFKELKLGTLICYEDIFSDLSREMVTQGANVLVNITNDAWYGNTSAQYQHLVFSQFRALETRRYLLRSTNTGITAIINPRGEVVQKLEPFKADILMGSVHPLSSKTFFTLLGNYVAWICSFLSLLGIVHITSVRSKLKE